MSAVFLAVLSLFIFLNPFPHVTSIKEGLYYIAVATAAIIVFGGKQKISLYTPLATPFSLFALWAFVSSLLAVEKAASLYSFYNHLLEYILFCYLVILGFGTRRKLQLLTCLLIVSIKIFSIGSLCYFYLWPGHGFAARFGEGFTDSAINVMGYATVPAMLLAGYFFLFQQNCWAKVMLAFSFLLTAASSVLTQSRGTILSLFVGLMILFFDTEKWSLLPCWLSVCLWH